MSYLFSTTLPSVDEPAITTSATCNKGPDLEQQPVDTNTEPAASRLTQSAEWVHLDQQQETTSELAADSPVSATKGDSFYLIYLQGQVQSLCDSVSKTPKQTQAIAATGLLLGIAAGALLYSQTSTIGSLRSEISSVKNEISSVQSQVRWKR